MSEELLKWLRVIEERNPGPEASRSDFDALITKCGELAGALEGLVTAARGIPHTGDNLVMGTLDVAIEVADAALRAPGGGGG